MDLVNLSQGSGIPGGKPAALAPAGVRRRHVTPLRTGLVRLSVPLRGRAGIGVPLGSAPGATDLPGASPGAEGAVTKVRPAGGDAGGGLGNGEGAWATFNPMQHAFAGRLGYANNWVRTQTLDLTQRKHVQVSAWFKYALETGYDYAFVEYSLDGGTTWNPTPLATFNGFQSSWQQVTMDAPMLDNQANVALRFRLKSDGGVVYDGIYVDDVTLSYQPYVCNYTPVPNAPTLVSPTDGTWVNNPVTFTWQPADSGVPAEGYILYLDDSPVITFTTPITTITLDVTPWAHTWFVNATTSSGVSLPSTTWSFDVFGKFFLPLTQK